MNESFETMRTPLPSFARVLLQSPYHRWLGLELVKFGQEGVTIALPWREEFVSSVTVGSTHGGILAALIDLTGLYAIRAAGGAVTATADLALTITDRPWARRC